MCTLVSWLQTLRQLFVLTGPFKVTITAMSKCEDSGTNQIVFPTKMYKRRELPPWTNGTITVGVPFDEKLSLQMEFCAWGNQGWRRRSIQHTAKGCEAVMRIVGSFWKRMYASEGIALENCPYPPAVLHLNGTDVLFQFDLVKELPYNKYKWIGTYLYDDVKVGCITLYMDVEPIDDKR